MKFSIVIVNYASWPLTLRCIEALEETKHEDFEVVVVDNDAEEVPELPGGARLIRNGRNLGFARAVNRGVSAASSGDLVVLMNPDTVVEHDFFDKVEAFFGAHPEAGISGPRVLDDDGAVQLSARREVSFLSGLFGRTSLLTRLLPESDLVRNEFPAVSHTDAPAKVDWVSGACMVVRREVFDTVGPLDERFFMYFEDADLCRRVRERGQAIYYLPHIEVVHRAGGSTRSRPRAVLDLHRSAFLYHRKHGRHGPFGLFSAAVFLGLAARALAKLAASR